MTRNVAIFTVAALLEIAGCFAFWAWLRRGVTPLVLILCITSLIGFALALTRVDSAFAGRAYAAYGCISARTLSGRNLSLHRREMVWTSRRV